MPSKSLKVKEFMTKYVFTVSPDVTVHRLVGLFITHPVSAIPVVVWALFRKGICFTRR